MIINSRDTLAMGQGHGRYCAFSMASSPYDVLRGHLREQQIWGDNIIILRILRAGLCEMERIR